MRHGLWRVNLADGSLTLIVARQWMPLRLPMLDSDRRLQVFISYSRKDLTAAEQIRDWLIAGGFGAYLDAHDILPGEPWQERLAALIEKADTVPTL